MALNCALLLFILAVFVVVQLYASLPRLPPARIATRLDFEFYRQHHRAFHGEAGANALKRFIVAHAAPRDSAVVIDVGANLGQATLPSDASVRTKHEVAIGYAFSPSTCFHLIEPNRANVNVLRQRAAALPCAIVTEAAVSSMPGTATFALGDNRNVAGNEHGALAPFAAATSTSMLVNVTTLNAYVALYAIASIDFLKIDTEGYDALVLEGASEILHSVRMILFECHKLQLAAYGGPNTSLARTAHALWKHGHFNTFIVSPRWFVRVTDDRRFDEMLQWQNCFAIRTPDALVSLLTRTFVV